VRALSIVVACALSACVTTSTTSSQPAADDPAVQAVAAAAEPLRGTPDDYTSLLTLIGDNSFVLLGESTHGTREFYLERARITRRLIEEKGFTVVAVEADWQDAYDVNEFIHGKGPATAVEAQQTFTRFPRWMWANTDVTELLEWMRAFNASEAGRLRPAGFYGMDLYGVAEAITEVTTVLKSVDPAAAARAAEHYKCLEPYLKRGMESYAMLSQGRSCARDVAIPFQELDQRMQRDGGHRPGDERLVSAWQSARVVMNGEAYYASAVDGVRSWNLRDTHMADSLDALALHLRGESARNAKVIVWAHNSHLGDAGVTQRAELGEVNVGQLMRQRHDGDTVIVGFTTYDGTVRAAQTWGDEGREMRLLPSRPDSFGALFHAANIPAFVLRIRDTPAVITALLPPRLQRFVGVVYVPATERQSHYFVTDLSRQYDAVVHVDRTSAVGPVTRTTTRDAR